MSSQRIRIFCLVFNTAFLLSSVAFGQESTKSGKLKMSVTPKQAYTFVDGKAIGPGNRTIKLDVGSSKKSRSIRIRQCRWT